MSATMEKIYEVGAIRLQRLQAAGSVLVFAGQVTAQLEKEAQEVGMLSDRGAALLDAAIIINTLATEYMKGAANE